MKISPLFALVCILWTASLPLAAAEKTRVDVMVVYTPAVTEHYNGHEGVLAHILATIAGSNMVFDNSDVPLFVNLVHAAEVDYVESDSFNEDFSRLRLPSDGYMDEIHAWRDEWGADLVSLFRRGASGGVAGVANLLTAPNGRPEQAFSVVSDVAALSNFTFAHELGHNLGGGHAHGDPGSDPIFEYARGHRFQGGDGLTYRTVMAYAPGTRIPHFSNPDVLYQGVPTGIPSAQPNPADMAGALVLTGPVVSTYRPEQSFLPEILAQPRDVTIVQGSGVRLRALVNGLPPLSFQWFAGDVGDVSSPVPGATDPVLWVDALSETSRFWVRATNAEGIAASRAAKVTVVPPPPPPYGITLQQPQVQNGYRVNAELWQEFVAPAGYIDELGLRLWRVGNPDGVTLELLDLSGEVLLERSIPGSSVESSVEWDVVSAALFVTPGQRYRVRLSPFGFHGDDDYLVWAGQSGGYPDGVSSVDPFAAGYAFTFRLIGADAWTYHTWLAGEGLGPGESNPADHPLEGGLPNLLRYALNLETPFGAGGLPGMGEWVTVNGVEHVVFEFRQRKAMRDAVIRVEVSGDLQDWEPVPPANIHSVPDSGDGMDRFEARLPATDSDALFFRLNAFLPD